MLVLRRTDRTGFVYGGMANYWDPPKTLRETMRSAARAVGEHLIERVGYRGPYGIDGVLTSAGFRPTELNPRATAGHVMPVYAAGLMAETMARAELAGDLEVDAQWLEETLLTAGDSQRGGRALMALADPPAESQGGCRLRRWQSQAGGPGAPPRNYPYPEPAPRVASCSSPSIRNELRTVHRLPPCRCRPEFRPRQVGPTDPTSGTRAGPVRCGSFLGTVTP
jgi:hypothetical protein